MHTAFHAGFVKKLSQRAHGMKHTFRSACEENATGGSPTSASREGKGASNTLSGTALMRVACVEILFFGAVVPSVLLWFGGAWKPELVLPALTLPSLLLGLRYGYFAGAAGALLCAAVCAVVINFRPEALQAFPKAQFIIVLISGITAGQFHDMWVGRLRNLRHRCDFHRIRLEQFTASYQLLQASHVRIERQLAHDASSLRTMLQRVPPAAAGVGLGGTGQWLLDAMAEVGNLHVAAVYEVNERGIVQQPPLATLGNAPQLSLFNPLLREVLRTGELTSVHATTEIAHNEVIAVVPLVDASRRIHGVVSVHAMPFVDLHRHTFNLLAVLGRHMGNILASRAKHLTTPTSNASDFYNSLKTLLADASRYGSSAALLVCKIVDTARCDALNALLCNSGRSLDQAWTSHDSDNGLVVVKLLPLTDESGVNSYLRRLDGEFGSALTRSITYYASTLDKTVTAEKVIAKICGDFDIDATRAKPADIKESPFMETAL